MRIFRHASEDESLSAFAMAVPISPERRQRLKDEGIYVATDPEFVKPNTLPHVDNKIKEIKALLGTDGRLTLPRIFPTPKQKSYIQLGEQQYILMGVKDPQVKANPEGSIFLFNIETGMPERKPLLPYLDQMRQIGEAEVREPTENVNRRIAKWNEMVSSVQSGKVDNPTTWPLQLKWAEDMLDERLGVLQSMMNALGRQVAHGSEMHPEYAGWLDELENGLRSGTISNPQDQIDSLVFLFIEAPQKAEAVLSQATGISEDVKNKVRTLIGKEEAGKEADRLEREQEEQARRERLQSEAPDVGQPTLTPIAPLEIEKQVKYPKAEGYAGWGSYGKQPVAKLMGVEQDYRELTDVRQAINGLRDLIAHLAAGERAKSVLYGTERGAEIMANVKMFIEKARNFLKRYASDAFIRNPEGTYGISPKLFGKGTVGNAEVAVALNQILGVVNRALATEQQPVPAEAVPARQPA